MEHKKEEKKKKPLNNMNAGQLSIKGKILMASSNFVQNNKHNFINYGAQSFY